MKNSIKIVFSLCLCILALLSACQSERDESSLDTTQEREPIMMGSVTALAIEQTSLLDGSLDNIIDGASCLTVIYPINVIANGTPLEITGVADLTLIESIFDADIEDDDILEIVYPITISTEEHQQIVINSDAELQANANSCDEGGTDFDNECIDFAYPMNFFVFNTISETTSRVRIRDDRDLFIFIKGLSADRIVSLSYPVSLTLSTGETLSVSSNQQLSDAILGASEDCDEDDDNNFDDDDFEEGELEELLLDCEWRIVILKRDGVIIEQYTLWNITFNPDGSLVVLDPPEVQGIDGSWTTQFTDEGSFLDMETSNVTELTFQWRVNRVDEKTIYIFSSSDNFLELNQVCEDD